MCNFLLFTFQIDKHKVTCYKTKDIYFIAYLLIFIELIFCFRRIPEIYHWQEIYIRKFKTRPLDKRREPWEYGINQFKRKLDDHHPRYVPKCLRENPKKKKIGKWANTYYP